MTTEANKVFQTCSPAAQWSDDGLIRIGLPFVTDDTKQLYLTKDFDIVHVGQKKIYTRKRDIDLEDVAFLNIPDLYIPDVSLPLIVLLASIFKPLGLPSDVFKPEDDGSYLGPKVKVLHGAFRRQPDQLFWQFPEGGIKVVGETTYFYVPGVSDAYVSANGSIFTTTKAVFNPGQNRTTYLVKSSADPEVLIELKKEQLAAFAFGLYDEENYTEVVYMADDSANPSMANLVDSYGSDSELSLELETHFAVLP